MKRYIRLYLYFLRFSISKALEFRIDFYFRVIMDCVAYITHFLFFKIIYLHTPLLGGWDLDQVTIFVVSVFFVDAFNMTFFATNTWWFPIYINKGNLDYYLTKPVSSFFFMGFKEIAANSFLNLILASTLLAYVLYTTPIVFSWHKIVFFLLLLINGATLYAMIFLLFLMSVFWTQSPRGFGDIFYTAQKVMERPDGIFSGYLRRFFLHLLPFSLMASYPTRYLITDSSNHIIFEIILTSIGIYTIVYLVWKKGLRSYSSASS